MSKNFVYCFVSKAPVLGAKADAKIRSLSYYFQMFLKVFSLFLLDQQNLQQDVNRKGLGSLTKRVQK